MSSEELHLARRLQVQDKSVCDTAGQGVGGLRGRWVIVVWTSHTTIIQQSYNNPYNNPYNNSFFLDEERILSRDKNKKVIVIEVTTCEATFNLLPLISGPIQNRLFLLFSLKSLNVNLVMALYSYWYCHVTQFTNKTNNILIYIFHKDYPSIFEY